MSVCAVENCEQEATETIRVTAETGSWQPRWHLLQEVQMDMPLCAGHYHLLTTDVLKGLSIG